MGGTCITHRRDEKSLLFEVLKLKTHTKDLGSDGRITLNYICNKHNVDVAKDRFLIKALVITIVNSRISYIRAVLGHLGE